MDFGHFCNRGRKAGANGPDRLIGDDGVGSSGAFGQGALQLAGNHLKRFAALALVKCFANADDGSKACRLGSFGLF